ncbi:MAG: hypothetical protein ABI130_03385 [Leifsonia sp.]
MESENALRAGNVIDPAAIGLSGTYAIDLTEATHSDIAVPETV